jgi:hypothetical protein
MLGMHRHEGHDLSPRRGQRSGGKGQHLSRTVGNEHLLRHEVAVPMPNIRALDRARIAILRDAQCLLSPLALRHVRGGAGPANHLAVFPKAHSIHRVPAHFARHGHAHLHRQART